MILKALVRLVSLAALALAGWWIGRVFRRAAQSPPRSRQAPSIEGRMVRDRVCNTFLPLESALELKTGGETRYFCSETCRDRFLAATKAAEPV